MQDYSNSWDERIVKSARDNVNGAMSMLVENVWAIQVYICIMFSGARVCSASHARALYIHHFHHHSWLALDRQSQHPRGIRVSRVNLYIMSVFPFAKCFDTSDRKCMKNVRV